MLYTRKLYSYALQGNLEAAVKEEEKRKSKANLIQGAIDGLKAKLEELGAQNDDSAELGRRLAQVSSRRISGLIVLNHILVTLLHSAIT